MIRINIENVKEKIIERHKKHYSKKTADALSNLSRFTNFISWFKNGGDIDTQKVQQLICANSKKELLKLITEIEPLISQDAISNAITTNDVKKEIESVFGKIYSNFSKSKWAFGFIRLTDVKVCPYCNRNYTFVIDNKGKQKPDFDHYFPKSKYPYLAISILNLVPCCSACNKGKGNDFVDKDNQTICYPYEEAFEDKILFETDLNEIEEWFDCNKHLAVKLCGEDNIIINAYNDAFKIDDLYSMHDDYTREIIKKALVFNEDFFESLFYSFPEIFSSPAEVKQIAFANYLEPDKVGKRPLSKLTQDILKEFRIKIS